MEHHGRGGWATDFQNDFPGEEMPTDIPGGGMPGPSGEKDINAGALCAPACYRHRDHYGGGKPPPPTVRPMRHDGPPVGPERQAPCYSPVCQGSGAKEAAARGGGGEGELGAGLRGIQGTNTRFLNIYIPGEGVDGRIKLLVCGVRQPWEDAEELGAVISDSEPGGGRSESVGKCLQVGSSGGVAVWGGDVGPHPEDEAVPGQYLIQGHKENHRESAAAMDGWDLELPVSGGGTEGSGLRGDEKVDHKEAEHGRIIYCNATDSGPL